MVKSLENRSLDRGISVLESLSEGGAMSLHQLFLATSLPKSTLRRLLSTLVKRRIVRVGLGDKLYRTNIALPDLSTVSLTPRAARLVEIAMPHMIELTRKIGWPSDLQMFADNRMRVIESTRTLSPYHINRSSLDIGVNVFGSAGGRAFLSALPQDELDSLIATTSADPERGLGRFGVSVQKLVDDLDTVRRCGYAMRIPGYGPVAVYDDRLSVIAVPLQQGSKSLGALTLLWPREYLGFEDFAAKHFGDLRDTSQKISEGLSKSG